MKKNILNILVFQIGWLLCVIGGNLVAMIYTALALLFHHRFIVTQASEWRILLLIALGGLLLDSFMVAIGVMHFNVNDFAGLPIWLMCLWLLFATTFQHGLGWLRRYLWLATLAAALFGPMSYWLGANLTEASIATPVPTSLAIMAMAWALLFPAGIYLANQSRAPK